MTGDLYRQLKDLDGKGDFEGRPDHTLTTRELVVTIPSAISIVQRTE